MDKELIAAILRGDYSSASTSLDRGANPNCRDSSNQYTALMSAARMGSLALVQLLVARGATLDTTLRGYSSAASIAAGGGHLNIVQHLTSSGANIRESMALFEASGFGKIDVVQFLLAQQVNPNMTKPTDLETPIYGAALRGHLEVVQCLIDAGGRIDVKNKKGEAPLTAASKRNNCPTTDKIAVMEYLLSCGAKINDRDNDGNTALHHVILGLGDGCIEKAEFLAGHGADFRAKNRSGVSAFTLAQQKKQTSITSYFSDIEAHRIIPTIVVQHTISFGGPTSSSHWGTPASSSTSTSRAIRPLSMIAPIPSMLPSVANAALTSRQTAAVTEGSTSPSAYTTNEVIVISGAAVAISLVGIWGATKVLGGSSQSPQPPSTTCLIM